MTLPCARARPAGDGAGQIFTLVSPHGEAQIVTRLLGAHNVSNLLLVAGVLYRLGSFAQIARELAATDPVDGRLQTVEPRSRPRALAARWWWWTMPTRLTRWRVRSPRCGRWRTPARAGWSACSAAAAIAIRASVRSWAASRRNWPTAWWCPATIRATKCRGHRPADHGRRARFGGCRGAGRPRPRHHADRLGLRAGRRAAAGWQGS